MQLSQSAPALPTREDGSPSSAPRPAHLADTGAGPFENSASASYARLSRRLDPGRRRERRSTGMLVTAPRHSRSVNRPGPAEPAPGSFHWTETFGSDEGAVPEYSMTGESPDGSPVRFSEGTRALLDSLRAHLDVYKVKTADLLKRLDLNGDGRVDAEELRVCITQVLGEEAVSKLPAGAVLRTLDEIDLDNSGHIEVQELRRAIWGNHREIRQRLRAGGAGKHNVRPRNKYRTRRTDIRDVGSRMLGPNGSQSLLSAPSMQDALREVLLKHAIRVNDLFREMDVDGDHQLAREEFADSIARLFGLRREDIGRARAKEARAAIKRLFDNWDAQQEGGARGALGFQTLHRLMRQGGVVQLPNYLCHEHIKQADIQTAIREKEALKAVPRADERSHALGIKILSKKKQLQKRAEKVAPCQLEAFPVPSPNLPRTFHRWRLASSRPCCARWSSRRRRWWICFCSGTPTRTARSASRSSSPPSRSSGSSSRKR